MTIERSTKWLLNLNIKNLGLASWIGEETHTILERSDRIAKTSFAATAMSLMVSVLAIIIAIRECS